MVAEYHGRYDSQTRKVHDIRDGVVYPPRFLSLQGTLIPLHARAAFGVSRPPSPWPRAAPPRTTGMRPLGLFELASAGAGERWAIEVRHGAPDDTAEAEEAYGHSPFVSAPETDSLLVARR